MSVKQGRREHIYELDYIRAISAILIVLYHYTTRYRESIGHIGTWPLEFPWGSWAVNTFFLLTGLLTVRNFKEGGLRFAFKRFARLWPAFAVSVLITTVFMAVLLPDRLRSVTEIILNFTMFPAYLGANPVDGVYWTLPLEIIFYFWMMIFMIGKNHRRLIWCLYGWVAVVLGLAVCDRIGLNAMPVNLLKLLFIPERAACFILGAAIALLNRKENLHLGVVLPLAALCVITLYLWLGWRVCLWTVAWAVVIFLVSTGKLRFAMKNTNVLHKCLLFVSAVSYTLYLLHQNIGFAIIRKLEQLGCDSQLWIFVPVALAFLLAAAVHYWVELPAGKWLLKKEAQLYERLHRKRLNHE